MNQLQNRLYLAIGITIQHLQNQLTPGWRTNDELKCVCLWIHHCQASVSDPVSLVTWSPSNIAQCLVVSGLPVEFTGN